MRTHSNQGFTLIELMIAVAIIAIISAIAYPAYKGYITTAKRSEAKSALQELALRQERHRAINTSYTTTMTDLTGMTPIITLPTGDHVYSILSGSATYFQVQADATSDPDCDPLTLDNGNNGAPTTCW